MDHQYKENGTRNIYIQTTVIRLFEDASLIEDAPNLQPYFLCKELQVMKNGKLPKRRRTPLLEYFMSSF